MASEEKDKDKKTESLPDGFGAATKESKLGTILTVLNLLITLGIGGVVYTQFQKDKHRESVSDIDTSAEGAKADEHGAPAEGHGEVKHGEPAQGEAAHGEAGAHGEAAAPKKSGPKVLTLDQFTVNLSTTVGTPPRFARVVIAIEVPSDDTSQELTQKMPQVRNAVIDLFNSKRPADLQTGEGRNFLKEEIRNALNSFLVTGKVKGVFFSNFQVSS